VQKAAADKLKRKRNNSVKNITANIDGFDFSFVCVRPLGPNTIGSAN